MPYLKISEDLIYENTGLRIFANELFRIPNVFRDTHLKEFLNEDCELSLEYQLYKQVLSTLPPEV